MIHDVQCALCRYVQSSQTDLPGPANAELRLREERLSRRVCSACCRPFSLLTNRCDIYTIYYLHYLQTGGAIVYIAHSCAGPRPTLATNTSNRGHTHSWKLATILSLRQQHYSFRNFLSSETMDYDVPKKSIY